MIGAGGEARTIRTPEGRTVEVRLRWEPDTDRLAHRTDRGFDRIRREYQEYADLAWFHELGGAWVAGVALALVGGFVLVVLGSLVATTGAGLVGLAALGAVVAGIAFAVRTWALPALGRRWVVDALDDRGAALRWRAADRAAGSRLARHVATQLAAGIVPPDHEPFEPT